MIRPWKYISPITLRILAVNMGALIILAFGLLYTGRYEEEMIETAQTALMAQGRILSIALSGSKSAQPLTPEQLRPVVRKLAESNLLHIILFDRKGALMLDSSRLGAAGDRSLPPATPLLRILRKTASLISSHLSLPSYPAGYPDIKSALQGTETVNAWYDNNRHIVLTAALPAQNNTTIVGALLVKRDARNIEDAVQDMQLTVLKLFLGALLTTVLLSIYLTEAIGTPLLRLAEAAQKVEQSLLLRDSIPDFSYRKDEIGALSSSLRSMTYALSERMDAISNFSADVAHEIKNPLASLKSAVETFALVQDQKQQKKLLAIIEADVERLDRLITDISAASRLDAEISRAEKTPLDLAPLLETFVHEEAKTRGLKDRLVLHLERGRRFIISGNMAQIRQVLDNLLQNAVSFLSPGGNISISCQRQKDKILIHVDNDGPPIPEKKLETIFERFYSERPESESFGLHSGLGLSITRQIIRSHKGAIFARNTVSEKGEHRGVRFTIILPAGAAS